MRLKIKEGAVEQFEAAYSLWFWCLLSKMALFSKVRVEVEGKEYTVLGKDFAETLKKVKAIKGREFDGGRSVWVLPCTVSAARHALRPLQMISSDDELKNAELEEAEQLRDWLLQHEARIQSLIESLEAERGDYTGRRRKPSAKSRNAWCLRCALKSALEPIENLDALAIGGMKRACEIAGRS